MYPHATITCRHYHCHAWPQRWKYILFGHRSCLLKSTNSNASFVEAVHWDCGLRIHLDYLSIVGLRMPLWPFISSNTGRLLASSSDRSISTFGESPPFTCSLANDDKKIMVSHLARGLIQKLMQSVCGLSELCATRLSDMSVPWKTSEYGVRWTEIKEIPMGYRRTRLE